MAQMRTTTTTLKRDIHDHRQRVQRLRRTQQPRADRAAAASAATGTANGWSVLLLLRLLPISRRRSYSWQSSLNGRLSAALAQLNASRERQQRQQEQQEDLRGSVGSLLLSSCASRVAPPEVL